MVFGCIPSSPQPGNIHRIKHTDLQIQRKKVRWVGFPKKGQAGIKVVPMMEISANNPPQKVSQMNALQTVLNIHALF
jgi:hypothetical protein